MAIRTVNWMTGQNYSPASDRSLIDGITVTPGVDSHTSFLVTQRPTASMKLNVSQGSAFVQGTRVAHQGMYHVYNDGAVEVDIRSSHSSMDRMDLISLVVEDSQYTSINPSTARIQVTEGTPASSPVVPLSPPDSIPLATIIVRRGVTAIGRADIQPQAPRATSLGGIAYARNYVEMAEGLPKIEGLHVYRRDIDRLMRCDGRTWDYINTKPSNDTGWMPINVATKYQAEPTRYRVYGDLVFTQGAIRGFQTNKKLTNTFNVVANLNKNYAPPYTVQVMSGINGWKPQGVEYNTNGNVRLYYQGDTTAWSVISTSWILN